MTTYQGGKKRLGKKIYDAILQLSAEIEQQNSQHSSIKMPYFEPFVGMGGVLRYFARDPGRDCFACDINTDLILMWKSIQEGWIPPTECSKEQYEELKNSNEHSAERAYLGIVASWGGIWFSSYRLNYPYDRQFLQEGFKGIMNIKPDIMEVNFLDAKPYYEHNPTGMLIYCDPPYYGNKFNTTFFSNFDHDLFWNTMRRWSDPKLGNIVVISESIAPEDFKKIASFTSTCTNNARKSKKYEDCLFTYNSTF